MKSEKLQEIRNTGVGRSGALTLLLAIAAVILPIYVALLALQAPVVNPDAGYYLTMAQALAEGQRLYADIKPSHLTLMMFVFGAMYRLWPEAPYELLLLLTMLMQGLSGFLVYVFARRLGTPGLIAIALGSMTVLAMLCADGVFIELEPYSTVLLLLIGIKLARPGQLYLDSLLLALLCAIAFWIKQYAGVAAIAVFLSLLLQRGISRSERTLRLSVFAAAYACLLPLYYYWIALQGNVPIGTVVQEIFGQRYSAIPGSFAALLQRLVWLCPYVLLFPLIPGLRGKLRSAPYAFALFCFAGGMLPGCMRSYGHYLIPVIPFAALLLPSATERLSRKGGRAIVTALVILGSALLSVLQILPTVSAWSGAGQAAAQQQEAQMINQTIPRGTAVFVIGDPTLNYLCGFKPPAAATIGYNFLEWTSAAEQLDALEQVRHAIIVKQPLSAERTSVALLRPVIAKEFSLIKVTERLEIWERS